MYFADLSPYTYCGGDGMMGLNIGWLDLEHEFTSGTVPDGVVQRLEEICKVPYQRHRGFHICELCKFPPLPKMDKVQQARDPGASSSVVIRVVGIDGRIYFSPAMICHYIATHGYRPPEEFIKAVMETELPAKPLTID